MAQPTPKREKVISALLLTGLVLIAAAIGLHGVFHPSNAQVSRPDRAPVATRQLPSGWTLASPWEVYLNGRLFEKIDGREPLFQQYGVAKLEFASLTGQNRQFDVYFYEMGDADGALGIYLAQTPAEFAEIDIGAAMADLSGGQIRAFQGKTYLELQPQDRSTDNKVTIALARSLIAGIPAEKSSGGTVFDALPKQGRVRGSLAINKESTFGLQSLNNTFSASYAVNGQSLDYLVERIGGDGEKTLQKVRDEIKEFDGRVVDSSSTRLVASMMGKSLILVREGNLLHGAYGDMAPAELEKLFAALRSEAHERK